MSRSLKKWGGRIELSTFPQEKSFYSLIFEIEIKIKNRPSGGLGDYMTMEFTVKEQEVLAFKRRKYARMLLNKAVGKGEILRPENCESCGVMDRLHGHHKNYGQPYEVNWLCPKCHGLVHRAGHPLNPDCNTQTPMPNCVSMYRSVTVAFTLSVENFIALRREAEKQKLPVSILIQALALKTYPILSNQLEFEFKEKAYDQPQILSHARISSLASDAGLREQPKRPVLQKVRRRRNLNISRMDGQLSSVYARLGSNAGSMQRPYAT